MLCFKVVNVGSLEFKEYDPQIVRVFSDDGKELPSEDKLMSLKAEVRDTESFKNFLLCRESEHRLRTLSGTDVKLVR